MAKTKRVTFNKGVLDRLPVPESGRTYVYDAKVRGLAICITSTGSKVFYLYCRMDRKPTRYRIGAWPDITVAQARDIATQRLAEVVDGRNPHRERIVKRHQLTLTKLFHRWVAEHAKVRVKSWRVDDSRFRNYVEPEFGDRAIESIESEELLTWHRRIGEQHGRVIANRVLCLVSRVFAWAERFGIYRGKNPCRIITRFPEDTRERFLQPDEAPRFFAALDAEPQLWQDLFRMCLLTGARRSNVQGMRWDQISGTVWTIPGGNAKSGKPIDVHLTAAAMAILDRRRGDARSEWVFPSPVASGPVRTVERSWRRILERAGLENFTPHDLRRTFGSYQALAGSSLVEIGRSLGHAPGSKATAIYARLTSDAVRQSAERGVALLMKSAEGGNGDG